MEAAGAVPAVIRPGTHTTVLTGLTRSAGQPGCDEQELHLRRERQHDLGRDEDKKAQEKEFGGPMLPPEPNAACCE